jgi:hypothetical protein
MRYPDTTDGRHKWRRDIESFLPPREGVSFRPQLTLELRRAGILFGLRVALASVLQWRIQPRLLRASDQA